MLTSTVGEAILGLLKSFCPIAMPLICFLSRGRERSAIAQRFVSRNIGELKAKYASTGTVHTDFANEIE
jgi:hypothetical protein